MAGVAFLLPGADQAERDATLEHGPQTVLVGERESNRARPVGLGFNVSEPPPPLLAIDGRVTAILYEPGSQIAGGDGIVEVDGFAIRAHRGDRPFHRDILRGSKGDDVAELARYLREAAGLEVPTSNETTAGAALDRAIRDYQRAIGAEVDGIFRSGYVVFFDSATQRLLEASITVGTRASDGSAIANGDGVADFGEVLTANGESLKMDVAGPYLVTNDAGLSLQVESTTFTGSAAEEMRSALQQLGQVPVPPNDFNPREMYQDLRIEAVNQTVVGTVVATAIHISPDGTYCVFILPDGAEPSEARAVPLNQAMTLDGETTIAAIDHSLAGESVARVASYLPPGIRSTCQ